MLTHVSFQIEDCVEVFFAKKTNSSHFFAHTLATALFMVLLYTSKVKNMGYGQITWTSMSCPRLSMFCPLKFHGTP